MITAKVISSAVDNNGNIKVTTEYSLPSGMKIQGHTRYDFTNFSKEKILQDIKAHCETLLIKAYTVKQNLIIVKTDLSDLKYTCSKAKIITKPAQIDEKGNVLKPEKSLDITDKD